MNKKTGQNKPTGLEIAVIGMAGRFPGAKNIAEFWDNLRNGVESLSFPWGEELERVPRQMRENPNYVNAKGGMLENKEYFDAVFFDYTPMEAEIMDPQVRLFHECVWEALEDAGYNPATYKGTIGLWAGSSFSIYWEGLAVLSGKRTRMGAFLTSQLTNKDFLATRIAYKLNLKGPAVMMQTACSTSLAAIHMAYQALLLGECKMALAGGLSVTHEEENGYIYTEGMVNSPDGHCRAFDARAKGTVFSSGGGVVLIKPFKNAVADRDHIYALVKGSAMNNDGDRKVGYTAPSVKGQTEVIRAAHRFAKVEPETITYVETHGTATALGDPIEVQALTKAFNTDKQHFCAIGSVKTNVGHLDCGAGVAGFIKTVLALKHRLIPPSLHFETPNPKIDFKNSPFYVTPSLIPWKCDENPLRAGVSAFGIGGTNTHVVLEEWRKAQSEVSSEQVVGSQARGEFTSPSREYRLIQLSARTETALDKMTQNLADHIEENPDLNLTDVAYTLQIGRKALENRRITVCSSLDEAVELLSTVNPEKVYTFRCDEEKPSVVFMFSGQGAQYVNMGLDLYQTESAFREEMDRGFNILETLLGKDIKEILYPTGSVNEMSGLNETSASKDSINDVVYSGPIKLLFEYSLARLLMKWGIQPYAMMGHSFGEYVAACLSGVFSLEDALKLAVLRGRLMEKTPPGAMLSVVLPQEELKPLLLKNDQLSLAAVNAPSLCIVSGPADAVDSFENQLKENGHECIRINFPRASHSQMMVPVLEEFIAGAGKITFKNPQIPYISGLTGKWVTGNQAMDPGYWARHLKETVRFSDGLRELLKKPRVIFLEVGPGRGLTLFLSQHPDKKNQHLGVNLVRHPREKISDVEMLLEKIGECWLHGMEYDSQALYPQQDRYRLPLPTYPFEGKRYWMTVEYQGVLEGLRSQAVPERKQDIADWFYIPSWKPSPLIKKITDTTQESPGQTHWLVFIDETGLGARLVNHMQQQGQEVVIVKASTAFGKKNSTSYTVNPQQKQDYELLLEGLFRDKKILHRVIHLWGVTADRNDPGHGEDPTFAWVDRTLEYGIFSLFYLAQAIGNMGMMEPMQVAAITSDMQAVTGEELKNPAKSTILSPLKVIPREFTNITCRSIDLHLPSTGSGQEERLVRQLWEELEMNEPEVAFRGSQRLVRHFEPLRLPKPPEKETILKKKGVYLVTGGLGGIGLQLAEFIARSLQARLILTGRSPFPPAQAWNQWLETNDPQDPVSIKIRKIRELEQLGAEVLVLCADISHYEQMQTVVNEVKKKWGCINGVIHASGFHGGGVIQRQTRETIGHILASKVKGTLILNHLLKNEPLDFMVLTSSASALLPEFGEVGYGAANVFLDAFAHYNTSIKGRFTTSINWGRWRGRGLSVQIEEEHRRRTGEEMAGGMPPEEAKEAFHRILENNITQLVVIETDFINQVKSYYQPPEEILPQAQDQAQPTVSRSKRPRLKNPYVPPGNPMEEKLTIVFQRFFGYEQVGIKDDFFELGGDSLKATVLVVNIHKELNIKIPLAEIFQTPTIKGLAKYIKGLKEEQFKPIEPVEKREYYPLSSAQKRLFFLEQYENIGTSYNVPQVIKIQGTPDNEGFHTVLKRLIQRHEPLRTSFAVIGEDPMQVVHNRAAFAIEEIQTREKDITMEVLQDKIRTFFRPFDLGQAPLLRAGIAPLPKQEYFLLLDVHHIITDGTSMEFLIDEFTKLHRGEELPPLKIQYRDFSQWQNHLFKSGQIKNQEKYWLGLYADLKEIPRLYLPTDYPRSKVVTFVGDHLGFKLDREETLKFKALSDELGVTLYMNLLAVFYVLLYKYSAQEDIVVGGGIMGRSHAGLSDVFGFFVNALALRNYPTSKKTYREFLGEVKETAIKAFENQDFQFEDLVDRLGLQRDPSRNPLFDVLFVFQNFEKSETTKALLETGNPGMSSFHFENRTTKFDLNLAADLIGNELFFSFEYSTELFKPSTIEEMAENYKSILHQVMQNQDIKIKDIKLLNQLLEASPRLSREEERDFVF
jgi:acyl transferase domain-containing protein/acyl carrier protein